MPDPIIHAYRHFRILCGSRRGRVVQLDPSRRRDPARDQVTCPDCLDVLSARGRPAPDGPRTQAVYVRVTPEEMRAVERIADRADQSISDWIRGLIRAAL